MLGEELDSYHEDIKKIAYRLAKSKASRVLYIQVNKLHHLNDPQMITFFKLSQELKTRYSEVKSLINWLVSLSLAEFKPNPTKTGNTPQMFGLRNPEFHKQIYKEFTIARKKLIQR